MSPSIFKSYDIRGLSPGEIDANFAKRLGETLAHIYKPKHVLVGHDMRGTSNELEEALVKAFAAQGVNVTRIGLCSTPMFYFAVGEHSNAYSLGVMVTASHNPAEYNGFKLVQGDAQPIGQGSGMEEIRDFACSDTPVERVGEASAGNVTTDGGVLTRYLDRTFQLAQLPADIPHWSISIDAGNGMNGHTLPEVSKRLSSIQIFPLYWDLDGSFPNHEANPIKVETLKDLQANVRDHHCAFGVAFDGDGDRVGFVDEEGVAIPGDMLTALFARELLRVKGSGRILYDLRSSWSVPEVIREHGGEPGMCRVGHAHIKRQMRKENAIFAGELSMHFYFTDMAYSEASDYAMLLLLSIVIREQKPLSQIWRPLQKYAHSGEINFHVSDQKGILSKLEEVYGSISTARSELDGLRYEFKDPSHPEQDWWFNVRASNTEPVLRLNLEARTSEEMEKRKAEVSKFLI